MSSFFIRVPGATLGDKERVEFMLLHDLVDKATDELLLRPDIDKTVEIVDAINALNNKKMLDEVVFLFRHKIGSKNHPKTVSLAITLLSAICQNCGLKVHRAINNEALLSDMMKVARRYVVRSGADCAEVTDVVLETLQSWGEAFLPLSQDFPLIVRAYHALRKEGLPFKAQYDSSRVPIFISAESNGREYGNTPEDMLAQTINNAATASAVVGGNGSMLRSGASSGSEGDSNSAHIRAPFSNKFTERTEQIKFTVSLLIDCAESKQSSVELFADDVVTEVVKSLLQFSRQTEALVIEALALDSPSVELLFFCNDLLMKTLHTFDECINNKISLTACKNAFREVKNSMNIGSGSSIATASAASAPTSCTAGNLLFADEHNSEFGTVVKPSQGTRSATTTADLLGLDSPARQHAEPEVSINGFGAISISSGAACTSSIDGFGNDGKGSTIKKITIPLLPPPPPPRK